MKTISSRLHEKTNIPKNSNLNTILSQLESKPIFYVKDCINVIATPTFLLAATHSLDLGCMHVC